MAQDGAGAPPFFVAHGDHDSLLPVQAARPFADRLRRTSSNSVVYAELPGGKYASSTASIPPCFEAVVDAIEAFAAWVRSREEIPRAEPRFRQWRGNQAPTGLAAARSGCPANDLSAGP